MPKGIGYGKRPAMMMKKKKKKTKKVAKKGMKKR